MGNFVKVVGVAVVDIWGGGFGGRDYQTRKKGEFLWLRLFLFFHLHTKSADIKPKCSKSLNGPKVIKKPECFFFPKICSKIVTSKIGCLPVCKAEKPLICLLSDSRITDKRGLFTSDYFQSAHSNWIQEQNSVTISCSAQHCSSLSRSKVKMRAAINHSTTEQQMYQLYYQKLAERILGFSLCYCCHCTRLFFPKIYLGLG